mmetsp:Transcript_3463/g.5891  ORF Transcript_3463/g.5891 Transcript_3463/m.5891 type:complete len:117 (+) Transcript_3463:2563-2913(+)
MLCDDARGVNEVLNETDSQGFGIKVSSTYRLQIVDIAHGQKSQQRQMQLLVDQPLQTFMTQYTKSAERSSVVTSSPPSFPSLPRFAKGKYVSFPLGKNKLMVRFENIGDVFDHLSN